MKSITEKLEAAIAFLNQQPVPTHGRYLWPYEKPSPRQQDICPTLAEMFVGLRHERT